jgi:hypothetical protein
MTTITIPRTREELIRRLDGLESLLTAKGWERTAIVYGCTYESGRGPRQGEALITVAEFIELGIYGLASASTVYRIRNDWKEAIANHGAADGFGPGDEVELPTVPYPHSRDKADGTPSDGIRDNLYADTAPERQAEAVAKVLERNAEVAELVTTKLAEELESVFVIKATQTRTPVARKLERAFVKKAGKDTALYSEVVREYEEQHPVPLPKHHPPVEFEADGTWAMVMGGAERAADTYLPRLLEYLQQEMEYGHDVTAMVEAQIEGLEGLVTLAHQYQDRIRVAVGRQPLHVAVDEGVDATARRLLGEVGL